MCDQSQQRRPGGADHHGGARTPSASPPTGVRSDFFLRIFPQGMDGDRARLSFHRAVGTTPTLVLSAAGQPVLAETSPTLRVGTDPTTGSVVLLHGEIHGERADPDRLAAALARRGIGAAAELYGCFALVRVDPRTPHVSVVTDRLGSRRVFMGRDGDGIWLASHLPAGMRGGLELDPTGVAWYLATGSIFAGRTAFRSVTVLERASVHDVSSEGVRTRPYWSCRFAGSAGGDPDRLADELGERVEAGVRRVLHDEPDVFLSMSGGDDAAGIAGVLRFALGVPNVRCFTYGLGRSGRHSDEAVAVRMSSLLGYGLRRIDSYGGDLGTLLRDNAEMGECSRGLVHEIDAWKEMAAEFASTPRPVALVGDLSLDAPGSASRLASVEDVLSSIRIVGFESLARIARHLPADTARSFAEGMAQDREWMLARCPPGSDLKDRQDFLYLDQRLCHVILPWREYFAGRYVTVRSPLLDKDVLEFLLTVPGQLRRGKWIWRRAVQRRFPQLLRIPRARHSNYQIDLRAEAARNLGHLRDLAARPSRLDDLVPPEALTHLLGTVARPRSAADRIGSTARSYLSRALPRAAQTILKRSLSAQAGQGTSVGSDVLLMRLLVLRLALGS